MLKTIIFSIIILTSLFYVPAYAAMVDKVVLTNQPDGILTSFEIKDAFTKDIEEAIKSGIPTSFTFFIEIYGKQGLWFDKLIASLNFKHTVKYDTLKEEYEIILEEKPQILTDLKVKSGTYLKSVPTIRVKDIEQAKRIMASGENIIIKPISTFKKGDTYQLRIKATLDAVSLPFPLNYMLFFVSFWNYETAWYEKEFISQ